MNLIAQTTRPKNNLILVGNVISDSVTFKNWNHFLTPISDSENKIEIRFSTNYAWEYSKRTTIVLSFNNDWSAILYYHKQKQNQDSVFTNEINKNVNLDTIFSRLVANNIFSLPDENTLTLEKCYYNTETNEISRDWMRILDGASYVIEFKVGKSIRRYCFSTPHEYATEFPSIYELRCYGNIVDIFNELTNEKRKKENK
jgi:hypothetical protein